jgi:hypothetical protein
MMNDDLNRDDICFVPVCIRVRDRVVRRLKKRRERNTTSASAYSRHWGKERFGLTVVAAVVYCVVSVVIVVVVVIVVCV